MNNKTIANYFSLLSNLLHIHGGNNFKATSYSIASYKIGRMSVELETLPQESIFKINGIGDAIGKKIIELLSTGKLKILDELIEKTPEGILEMLKIKGLGPKKISLIWKEMGIENIGELFYACNENRLSLYKGFGKKTQQNVIESIEFYLAQQGSFLFAQVESLGESLEKLFQKIFNSKKIIVTGEYRRHAETIKEIEFVIPFSANEILNRLKVEEEFLFVEKQGESIVYKYNNTINVKIHFTNENHLQQKLFTTTGSSEFILAFDHQFPSINFNKIKTETDIFEQAGIQFVPPFLRESASIISIAEKNKIKPVIQPSDIRGIIHCHSNWSDGINTIEQLANACKDSGKEYLVISDHSKTASYAHGLTEEQVKSQHLLIDELNEKLFPFKIFKSIESDILNDGSLDYSNSVLSTFDLVIASVHSNLKMSKEKAMMRIIRAIENPFTTILGHMTGRLLLSRKGFPVDYKKVIDACASNKVVIEINAHPHRLDMRWQWIEYALSKNIILSVNPDAHSIPEFSNTRYGVLAAQKGMLTKEDNLSSFSLKDFENFLLKK